MAAFEHYYVNNVAQSNGDHEVHKEGCLFFPGDKTHLGYFDNCQEAVEKAKEHFAQTNGCFSCCRPCHTS